jgi:hypothetical protein
MSPVLESRTFCALFGECEVQALKDEKARLATRVAELEAVMTGVHNVLNHPVKAGKVWATYRRPQIEYSLGQMFGLLKKEGPSTPAPLGPH